MCSIIGALLHNSEFKTHKHLKHILDSSRTRGRDGYGWHVFHNGLTKVYVDDFYVAGTTEDNVVVPNLLSDAVNSTVIGNFRAEPTTEYVQDKTVFDQQPYQGDGWVIAHNGTIANDKELRTNKLKTSIDSAAILEQLCETDTEGTYGSFRKVIKQLQGSYAILASHKKRCDHMFFAVNYRPLWYVINDSGVFFASCETFFPEDMFPKRIPPYSTGCFWLVGDEVHKLIESLHVPKEKERALVIASGGLDSTVAASQCIEQGYEVELLHFQYGCRAEEHEVEAIKKIGHRLGVETNLAPLPIYKPTSSKLFDKDSEIAGGEEGAEFAHEWVPARNLVLLSVATAYAEAEGFDYIVLGNNMEEAGAYPDNEPEFIKQFNKILPFAVGDGKRVQVLMPVGDLMKHEIVRLGYNLGAPMDLTWSCYRNMDNGLHCGKCGPCFMRRTAFEINKLDEVITYES